MKNPSYNPMNLQIVKVKYYICFIYWLFTDALQQGASQFEQQAGKLKRKMWWKNLKVSSSWLEGCDTWVI